MFNQTITVFLGKSPLPEEEMIPIQILYTTWPRSDALIIATKRTQLGDLQVQRF